MQRSRKKGVHPYVEVVSRSSGVRAVVKGTRIKVTDIALRYDLMGWTPDQIIEQFPHLNLPQVHDALSYYYEHKTELDRQSKADDAIVAELKRKYSSRPGRKTG